MGFFPPADFVLSNIIFFLVFLIDLEINIAFMSVYVPHLFVLVHHYHQSKKESTHTQKATYVASISLGKMEQILPSDLCMGLL